VEFICKITNERRRINDSIVIVYAGVLHSFKSYSMIYPEGQQNQFIEVESGKMEKLNQSNKKKNVIYFDSRLFLHSNSQIEIGGKSYQ